MLERVLFCSFLFVHHVMLFCLCIFEGETKIFVVISIITKMAQWRSGQALNLRWVQFPSETKLRNNLGHTYMPVTSTKQYNLVPVEGR